MLDEHGLIGSMSARGNCYDNTAMERWNHSLKVEPYMANASPPASAPTQVFDYIEIYHNRQRLHSTLGYVSPEEFELSRVA